MSSIAGDFETKATDVIGLFLHPPQLAVAVSLDEPTAIQALDRPDPVLPLTPGRAERHGFEYFATERCRSTLPLIPRAVRSLDRPQSVLPVRSSSPFLPTMLEVSPLTKRFMSSFSISRLIKLTEFRLFLADHPPVHVHSTRSTPHGLTD